jgi:presequence protease
MRREILNTTVDDIKNYAGFVDALIAQKQVFVIASREGTADIAFPFEYSVNSSDFTVTPRLATWVETEKDAAMPIQSL